MRQPIQTRTTYAALTIFLDYTAKRSNLCGRMETTDDIAHALHFCTVPNDESAFEIHSDFSLCQGPLDEQKQVRFQSRKPNSGDDPRCRKITGM